MIKISADSTCDLTKEIVEDLDITIIPLGVVVDGECFHDGVDITPAQLFDYVEKEKKQCSTTAVNVFEYKTYFEDALKTYEAVIHICISAEFSTSYANAVAAAEELENVYIVDSRNLSTGSGHLVLDAVEMAKKGIPAQEIVDTLNETAKRVEASFVIDRLDYLRRGGRCSAMAAFGGALLNIKPSIEVVDGKMTVGKKYTGTFEKCLRRYVKERLNGREDIDTSRIFITHTLCDDGIPEMVCKTMEEYMHFDEVIETIAGCTVSNHCGPNTLGILFKRKQ